MESIYKVNCKVLWSPSHYKGSLIFPKSIQSCLKLSPAIPSQDQAIQPKSMSSWILYRLFQVQLKASQVMFKFKSSFSQVQVIIGQFRVQLTQVQAVSNQVHLIQTQVLLFQRQVHVTSTSMNSNWSLSKSNLCCQKNKSSQGKCKLSFKVKFT